MKRFVVLFALLLGFAGTMHAQPSRGFFNQSKWSRLTIGTMENAKFGEIAWARMVGKSVELGSSVQGNLYDVDPDDYWFSLQVGVHLNIFILQPRGANPFGVYGGGFAGITPNYYFGSNYPQDVSTFHYGGEAGVYLHIGKRTLLVPRAALQVRQVVYLGDDRPPSAALFEGIAEDGDFMQVLLGADLRLGDVIPGILLTFGDDRSSIAGRLTFAL